ncbi:MAG TPA: hypothetical protein VND64_25305 [Pirellulales bacterium]|nr:hypothetical protein [Pirellulales bacterium]
MIARFTVEASSTRSGTRAAPAVVAHHLVHHRDKLVGVGEADGFLQFRADDLIHHRDKLEGVWYHDQTVLEAYPKTARQSGRPHHKVVWDRLV